MILCGAVAVSRVDYRYPPYSGIKISRDGCMTVTPRMPSATAQNYQVEKNTAESQKPTYSSNRPRLFVSSETLNFRYSSSQQKCKKCRIKFTVSFKNSTVSDAHADPILVIGPKHQVRIRIQHLGPVSNMFYMKVELACWGVTFETWWTIADLFFPRCLWTLEMMAKEIMWCRFKFLGRHLGGWDLMEAASGDVITEVSIVALTGVISPPLCYL